jgi:hypothetical protein
MKKYIFTMFLTVAAAGISMQGHSQAPDYLGLPGDNLNLFAVMKLFQESQTLEIFERDLNNQDMHINNLDLDQDGRIDYIRVIDNADGNYHTIVLQDALSPRDIQDVAVFTVYRDRQNRVSIQLTGDEALYGRDYIVEPNYSDLEYNETPNPGYTYDNSYGETVVVNRTSTLEVSMWPLVRFMFLPNYVVWHSPWHYNYYPSYWRPWRPYYWHYYYGYHYNWDPYYYGHYRVYHYHRDPYWHDTYYSQRRVYSPVVTTRVQSGSYRKTYSHPQSRKAGYDMYYKKHPDQVARRSSRTIDDPVVRKSTQQRNTTTTGRRTSGDSRSRNQGSQTVQPNTRSRSNETVQPNTRSRSTETGKPNTRSRSTGTSTDTRVKTTDQRPGTQGSRTQTQTQTRTQTQTQSQTRTQSQPRTTEKSTGTRSTETRSSGQRRSSDANTSRTSGTPTEKKDSGTAKPREKRGGERRTAQ